MEVMHSRHISSFMEKKTQLAFQKRVIFIGGASGGLIVLRGLVLFYIEDNVQFKFEGVGW